MRQLIGNYVTSHKFIFSRIIRICEIEKIFFLDKNIIVNENTAEISHDGSLTIGKLGAAKKEELLNFIIEEKPEIVSNNKIILGILKINEEIDINSLDCKNYIENCIDYAILRDKFREIKKGCR